jgi:[ribosomal protein S18]-alanine N-acetyltransferase
MLQNKDTRMPAPYRIRRLRASDLDRILEIERDSFGRDAYERDLFVAYLDKCGPLFLTAEREGRVWGYLIACIRGDRAELVSIAVDPAERGRGAASALMDGVLRRLRRRGVVRIALTVKVTNRKALAFYAKYAFQRVRRVRRYYEDGADGWLMARKI